MSDYQREPNENWLEDNQSDTVLLQFPHGEYAVTVHSDQAKEHLLDGGDVVVESHEGSPMVTAEDFDGGVPADD